MPAAGTLGKGTVLSHSTTQGGSYTPVAKVRGPIKPPAKKIGSAETTTFEDAADQFIPGFLGAGEASAVALYVTATAAALSALVGSVLWWHIVLPDTHVWEFEGWIEEYQPDVPLKDAIVDSIKFKVNGTPTYT